MLIFRCDCYDRLANIPDPIPCENWMLRNNLHPGSNPIAWKVTDSLQVARGKDCLNSRLSSSGGCVDCEKPGVSVGRTQKLDAQASRGRNQVRDVTSAAS